MAQRFEERAQANYQRYLNHTEEQKKADEAILEKKFADLYGMLSKAHLGRRWVFWKNTARCFPSMSQRNLKASIVETLT